MAGVTGVTSRDNRDSSRLRERDERDAPPIGASRRHGAVTGAAETPNYGPWATGIDLAERKARLRALRALVRTYAGPHGTELVEALRKAETDPEALERAGRLLGALRPIPFRHVLAAYAALEAA